MREIGCKYEVIYGETTDGVFEKEEMTLLQMKDYKGKTVYLFRDSQGYEVASYNHGKDIDWEFMEEINNKFT